MKATLALALVALAAAPAFAYEPVTCKKNATQNIITSIKDANNFCTMLTGYGVDPVAPNEGCASVYCQGEIANGGQPMPKGYILSSTFAKNDTANYIQVTGCIDSSVWAQNPADEGGQMDSHGWPYSCQGYKKFVSLIEPATNTFCLRCCMSTDNSDCNTSVSTKGCWNVVPGLYQMPDGSVCKPPAGSPNSTLPTSGTPTSSAGVSASGTITLPTSSGTPGTNPGTGPSPNNGSGTGSGSGSGTGSGSGNKTNPAPSSGARSLSVEMIGSIAALALAAAANL